MLPNDRPDQNQLEFLELAERLREATDPDEIAELGDRLGRLVFGG